MNRRRPLPGIVASLLALLMQLWLPAAHAALMAQRSGDPLAYAYCGQGSAALQQKLRAYRLTLSETTPASDLDSGTGASTAAGCTLCAGLHQAPMLPMDGSASNLEALPSSADISTTSARIVAARAPGPPPARGPPTHS